MGPSVQMCKRQSETITYKLHYENDMFGPWYQNKHNADNKCQRQWLTLEVCSRKNLKRFFIACDKDVTIFYWCFYPRSKMLWVIGERYSEAWKF